MLKYQIYFNVIFGDFGVIPSLWCFGVCC